MNLRSLQYLVALSQQGSFRSAANALGVAQPSISTQIRRFEDELGAKLVVRSTQGAQLTELGQKVVIEALEIFSIVDRIKSLANGKDPSHREAYFPPCLRICCLTYCRNCARWLPIYTCWSTIRSRLCL